MTLSSGSNVRRVLLGFVLPLISQPVITATLGWINIKWGWKTGVLMFLSFAITSGVGFILLSRNYSAKEKALIAIGYFPMMLIAFYIEGLYILLNIPGTHGNF